MAQVTTAIGKRPTVMFVRRKPGVQSGWPERLTAVRRRKPQNWPVGLETAELAAQAFRYLRPYLKPERVRGNKERQTVDGLLNSGSRLHVSSTRRIEPQGEIRRKASGNGRGREA